MPPIAWVIIAILVVVGILWVSVYNSLVKLRLYVKEAWSQIDVQLQRRNDLIPNLVETVKGYASHEQETLTKVIQMRNQLQSMGDGDPQAKMDLSNQLTNTLRSLFAVAEAYPDLKANTNFLELQNQLVDTENKISYSRQLYNSSVTQYNVKRETFPNNIISGIHGFAEMKVLETPAEAKEAPKVQF